VLGMENTTTPTTTEITNGALVPAYQDAKRWAEQGLCEEEFQRRTAYMDEGARWIYTNGYRAGLT
jgi:hypothetical protein